MESSEKRNSDWRGRSIRYAPLILWIGVIFFASSSFGSMSNTSTFIRPILEFFFPDSPESTIRIYHGYLRKFAHFAEYGVLAFFAARAFRSSSKSIPQTFWHLSSFAVVAIVASTDEFNQRFNLVRTGSIFDVMIDIGGGIFTILILVIFTTYRTKFRTKQFK